MVEEIYSPGLEGIVAGETAISTLAQGLEYRGYSIEDLGREATFEQVAYLLLYGELPDKDQLAAFKRRLGEAAHVPTPIIDVLRKLPSIANMMDIMRSGASLLAHWDPEVADNSREAELRKAERLLAQLPVIMAAAHRLRNSKEPVLADPARGFAENLLYMLLRQNQPSPSAVKAMDVSLIMYAEHEYNASTFTARVVASTLSDMHSAVTAAIGSLKGPLHGGANEQVMKVLAEVGSIENAETWVRDALAKKVRIMGFGHRVYKDGDPRATFLKVLCHELAEQSGHQEMEQMADKIESIVREEKRIPPNLDWPSARIYHYLGLPVELYTPLFVVSRVVGWSAHVIEQHAANRLIRPRSRYTGPASRGWVALEDRQAGA
jgi:2-methylcitrate synthase/citrate synthase II